MHYPILNDIIIIFALSLLVIFIFHRLKLPSLIGFLITGSLAGPYASGLVKSVTEVEVLAEIGVLLLLFTIGIEFSLKEIIKLKRSVFGGGSVQAILTTFLAAFVFYFSGFGLNQSIFFGFLITLSSTAIIIKLLDQRGELQTAYGKISLSILIFQDIIVVPMMFLVPILAGAGQDGEFGYGILLKAVVFIVVILVLAKYVIPWLLFQAARTKSRELFLLTIFVVCFGVVWLASLTGLSLALGAFISGLIISESEYSHQALSNILPFRDLFTSFFFVSVGMLLNVSFLLNNFVLVALLVIAIIIFKVITSVGAGFASGSDLRISLATGFILAQVGEFSFVLANSGQQYGLLSDSELQLFLSISIITMALTPFLNSAALPVAERITGLRFFRRFSPARNYETPQSGGITNHLIIVGYGVNGKNLARAAGLSGISYIVIEMNPDTVLREKKNGQPIFYGDASSREILLHAGIRDARILVIAINNPADQSGIVHTVKELNSGIHLIVRTRYLKEVNFLKSIGADEVIPEEFETSIEIFARVLENYSVPQNRIDRLIEEIRADEYKMFRSFKHIQTNDISLVLPANDIKIINLEVPQKSYLHGKTLAEIDFRNKTGINIIALRRGDQIIGNPGGATILMELDQVIISGERSCVIEAKKLLESSVIYGDTN